MLTISNIYGHGYNATQIERIQSLGFRIRPLVSRFAGTQVLYFVDFSEGPALEFIVVENEGEYLEFVPPGMVPYCPGINLLLSPESPYQINDYKIEFQAWGTNGRHVNYDGTDAPGQPGWNYLNFATPVVSNTFIYLSQPDAPRPVIHITSDHPNSVLRVDGIVFDLEEGHLTKLAQLTGKDLIGGIIDLNGLKIWSAKAMASEIKLPDKQFPLKAILLKATTLDYFQSHQDVKITELLSKPVAYIAMPAFSWDLIVMV